MTVNINKEQFDILSMISDQSGANTFLTELTTLNKNTRDHFLGREPYYLIIMIVEKMVQINLPTHSTLTEHLKISKVKASGFSAKDLKDNIPTLTPCLRLIEDATNAQLHDWLTILAHMTITNSNVLTNLNDGWQSRDLTLNMNIYSSCVTVSASDEYCKEHRVSQMNQLGQIMA